EILASLNIPKPIGRIAQANSQRKTNSTPKKQASKRKREDSPSTYSTPPQSTGRRTSARLQQRVCIHITLSFRAHSCQATIDYSENNDRMSFKNLKDEDDDESASYDEEDSDEGDSHERRVSRPSNHRRVSGLNRRIVNGRNVAHIDKNFNR